MHDVGIGAARKCEPVMPGSGNKFYLFDIDKCFKKKIPTPMTGTNQYSWNDLFAPTNGDLGLAGNLIGVKIKANSGHPTGTKEEGGVVYSQGYEAQVDKNVDEFAELDRIISFLNLGLITSDNAGKFYVYMSASNELVYSSNFEGGQNVGDDTGFTATFTYSPCFHAMNKVVPPEEGINLDQYLSSAEGYKGSGDSVAITITPVAEGGTLTVKNAEGKVLQTGDEVTVGSPIHIYAKPATGKRINTIDVTPQGGTKAIYTDQNVTVYASKALTIAATFETNA